MTNLYLKLALSQAKIQQGFCFPNPAVGAVVVKDDQVLAEGYHLGPGCPHAEPDALNKLGEEARGATLYVTLEPCCTFGRTPPCTDLIIQRGIQKVVFAYYDPNPNVAGKGIEVLTAAGVSCEYAPQPDIDAFYQAYKHWHQTRFPWVTAKLALSLDGKISTNHTTPTQISSGALQRYTHQRRKAACALLTTAKTIIADDPMLNVRLDGEIYQKSLYLLDRELKVPLDAKVFLTAKSITIFYDEGRRPGHGWPGSMLMDGKLDGRSDCAKPVRQFSDNTSIRYVAIPTQNNKLAWSAIMKQIGEDGVHHLWVEAGSLCFESLALSDYLSEAIFYLSPKILGPQAYPAFHRADLLDRFKQVKCETIGEEVIYTFN